MKISFGAGIAEGSPNVLAGVNRAAPRGFVSAVGMAVALLSAITVVAQSDDFSDGNDDGWTRYDPVGSHPQLPDIATFSVVSNAYRIQTVGSPLPGVVGPARAGGLRRDVIYTNFYATVDLVAWDESLEQSVGIMARTRQVGLGTTDGYVMTYNFRGKDIDITRFTDEDPVGGSLTLSGEDGLELEKGKRYRLVFYGQGTDLGAKVFNLENLEVPLVAVTASDATYAAGFSGLLVYDNSSSAAGATDATFDNYFALSQEPPKIEYRDLGFGLVQVLWPGSAGEFRLEFTEQWPATAWTTVNEVDIGFFPEFDRFIYSADALSGNRYYRLIKR